jgi:beta-mannosidase
MQTIHDLSAIDWHIAGFIPFQWQLESVEGIGATSSADIPKTPAPVPGSVQQALLDAGVIPNWYSGLDARLCEWVENRHWIYEVELPGEWFTPGKSARLVCEGLDYGGWVLLNGVEIGHFRGTHVPHVFDLTGKTRDGANSLRIAFDCPPRWLGQFGYTSRMTEWKPRYNYTWDWISRVVQIGIWDQIRVEISDGNEITGLDIDTDYVDGAGLLRIRGKTSGDAGERVRITLGDVLTEECTVDQYRADCAFDGLSVQRWYPNGMGEQPLYDLTVEMLDADGAVLDVESRRLGFRHIEWQACEGAPTDADPWICVVNGESVFLQGVNWTPIRPNFADVPDEEYRKRLIAYRDMGCNVMRVWGGGYLEKTVFYDLCDELGLLVWQEFPLSSSGLDNWPPDDDQSIRELSVIARSFIERRKHHASLFVWCGGNELVMGFDGERAGQEVPVDGSHPLLRRFGEIVAETDPSRRYLATSSSGPRFYANEEDFGKGMHWDVHGPWKPDSDVESWKHYFDGDDALFRSETGCPGASPVDIIREFSGGLDITPGTYDNPLWRRTSWWIEWHTFINEIGREPESIEEYVTWSQSRQAEVLAYAASQCKERFPECGGFILWMGHDSFPCTANTSIIDFHGRYKPAAEALSRVFKGEQA